MKGRLSTLERDPRLEYLRVEGKYGWMYGVKILYPLSLIGHRRIKYQPTPTNFDSKGTLLHFGSVSNMHLWPTYPNIQQQISSRIDLSSSSAAQRYNLWKYSSGWVVVEVGRHHWKELYTWPPL